MKQDEHQIQKGIIEWCAYQETKFPELKLLFAVPNGGQRNVVVARKIKAEGGKRGVPDLFLPVARGGYHGLFIEMKTPTGALKKEQKVWIKELIQQGYMAVVCRSINDATKVLSSYLLEVSELQSIASEFCPKSLRPAKSKVLE